MTHPLAYHITLATYGTRLHGDDRGTVDRTMNRPGDPIISACSDGERMERNLLRFPPRIFTRDQMILIESLIPGVCARGNWTLHTCAAAPNHLHTLLTGSADGDAIRKWFKRFLTESLMAHPPCPPAKPSGPRVDRSAGSGRKTISPAPAHTCTPNARQSTDPRNRTVPVRIAATAANLSVPRGTFP